jgi:hypothetical protein
MGSGGPIPVRRRRVVFDGRKFPAIPDQIQEAANDRAVVLLDSHKTSPVPYLLPVCLSGCPLDPRGAPCRARLCHVRPVRWASARCRESGHLDISSLARRTTGRQGRRQPRPGRAAGPAGRPPSPGPAPWACRSISAPVNITSQPALWSRDAWPHRPTPARSRAPPAYFSPSFPQAP